jgi:hypothetical protein
MSSLANDPQVPGLPVGVGIFASLEREWRRTARSSAMRAQVRAWAATEPLLRGFASADAVIAGISWERYRPSPAGALVLSALLRQATAPLGARALLQALLPRIRLEDVFTATYGHRTGEGWPRPADTVADLVAECFVAIRRHAGEDRDDVARLVVGEATRRLRTARQVQRRYEVRTVVLLPDHSGRQPVDLLAARSAAEWLAVVLSGAVRRGEMSAEAARLVYATRVKGTRASTVGRDQGMQPRAVYYALAKAERGLMAAA